MFSPIWAAPKNEVILNKVLQEMFGTTDVQYIRFVLLPVICDFPRPEWLSATVVLPRKTDAQSQLGISAFPLIDFMFAAAHYDAHARAGVMFMRSLVDQTLVHDELDFDWSTPWDLGVIGRFDLVKNMYNPVYGQLVGITQ